MEVKSRIMFLIQSDKNTGAPIYGANITVGQLTRFGIINKEHSETMEERAIVGDPNLSVNLK